MQPRPAIPTFEAPAPVALVTDSSRRILWIVGLYRAVCGALLLGAALFVWYQLLEIACDPQIRGNRFSLEPTSKMERGRGRLVPRSIPSDLIALRDEYLRSLPETPTLALGQTIILPEDSV